MSSLTPLIDEGLSSIPGIFCVYICDGVLCLNQSADKKKKKKKKKESASTTAVVIYIVVLVDLKKFPISILPEF